MQAMCFLDVVDPDDRGCGQCYTSSVRNGDGYEIEHRSSEMQQ
jgi:hypothetical protein